PLLTAVCGVMVTPWGVRTLPHGPSMCVASLGAVGLALLG
ncbi:prepilin peptidase, partial [Mycobacterium tuberculosis]|nr:prepilin peptidase [Mycobacterium tuberculosis]